MGKQRDWYSHGTSDRVRAKLRISELMENTTYVVYLVYQIEATYFKESELTFLCNIPYTTLRFDVEHEDEEDLQEEVYSCLVPDEDILKFLNQVPKRLGIYHLSKENAERQIQYYFHRSEFRRAMDAGNFPKKREGRQWLETTLLEEKSCLLIFIGLIV